MTKLPLIKRSTVNDVEPKLKAARAHPKNGHILNYEMNFHDPRLNPRLFVRR